MQTQHTYHLFMHEFSTHAKTTRVLFQWKLLLADRLSAILVTKSTILDGFKFANCLKIHFECDL